MGGGEVVRVHGGHIIRSTSGKKDRHSKVYTAKGARDRRVRLAAHTAIQFYDVQDRLGYDRPSKAVDWLMEKAKDAIDKLDRLPPFNPNAVNGSDFPVTDHAAPVMGFDSGYPHRDLCLSLQSFQNGAGFEPESGFPVVWSSEINNPADMGRFSRLLTGSEVDSGFHSQPSIQAWDDLPMGPTQHHQFMGFCAPVQIDGDNGEEVDRMMVAAGHHHHGASSLSTTTDSSH